MKEIDRLLEKLTWELEGVSPTKSKEEKEKISNIILEINKLRNKIAV